MEKELKAMKTLFKSDGGGINTACLNFASNPFDLYSTGYLQAGDILIDFVVENQKYHDTIVYPAVFNYRQYLELKLKEIIWSGRDLLNRPGKYPKNHQLLGLWNIAQELLAVIWPGAEKPVDYILTTTVIEEFQTLDKASDAFRFPEDQDGRKHLGDMKLLNLPNLKIVMAEVSSFLDAVSLGISEYRDKKNAMMAEISFG